MPSSPGQNSKPKPEYFTNTRLVGLIFLLLTTLYIYFTGDIQLDFWSEDEVFNARSMPYIFGGAGLVCSMLLIFLPSPQFDWQPLASLSWKPAILLLITTSLFGLIIEVLGFLVASSLFLFCAFAILGERKWIKMATVGFGLTFGFWLLMGKLGIFLSPGDLWLGMFNA